MGLLPFVLIASLFFWVPMVLFFQVGLRLDAGPWIDLFTSAAKLRALNTTFWIGFQTTAICLFLSYFYVGALINAGPTLRAVLIFALVVPFLTSTVVRTFAWTIVLGNNGAVNTVLRAWLGAGAGQQLIYNRTGVLIGMVHVLLPFMVLPLYAVMSQVPSNLMRAAQSLGANVVTAYTSTFLRLSLPGAAAGCVLVFIQAIGFYVTPAIMGGANERMIAQFIQRDMLQYTDFAAASALAAVLVVAVVAVIMLFRIFYPLENLVIQDGGINTSMRSVRRAASLGGHSGDAALLLERAWRGLSKLMSLVPWRLVGAVNASGLAAFFLLPLLVVIPVSFTADGFLQFPPRALDGHWYRIVARDAGWQVVVFNSLIVGLVAVIGALAVSVPLAFSIVRGRIATSIKAILLGLVLVPAIVPTIVIAAGTYVWFLQARLIGNLVALGLSHAVLATPYATLILVAGLRGFNVQIERAARSLGAGPVRTFGLVTLPLVGAAVLSGALFSFLISFDELLIAQSVTTVANSTVPVKLWIGANEEISPALAVISTFGVTIALLGASLLHLINRFKSYSSGRHNGAR